MHDPQRSRRHRRAHLSGVWLALAAACTATPEPLARPVSFPGVSALGQSELHALVADAANAAPGDAERLARAAEALRRAYHARGYADVEVTPAELAGGALEFTVVEGRRWSINQLSVSGNSAVATDDLLRLWGYIEGLRAPLAPTFRAGDPLDPDELGRWLQLVQTRYLDAGYLDARLDAPTVERDDVTGSAKVSLHVAHEGPRYRIDGFAVPESLPALLGDDLPSAPLGEFCTRGQVETFVGRVLAALRRRGHAEPELRVSADRDAAAGKVSLRLAVAAGPARTVEEVEVLGSRRVPKALVRDKLGLRVGQRFDGDIERRGIATLSATGEFERLDVRYEPLDDERMRVLIDTQETTGLVLRGAPYVHPWRRLGYNFMVEGRDVLGDRHDLLGHVHVGYRGYHFGGRYLHSGIFDENTSLTVGGDFFYNERPAFTDRGAGGTVELRRYMGEGLSLSASYALMQHFDTTFDAASTSNVGRDYTEGRVSLAADLDGTDNRLLPTRGHKAFVRLDRVDDAFGADVEFTRLRVGAGLWLPLNERLRWSLEAEAGLLWPGRGSAGVPVPERFFLGGYDTVRSFRESRLGPRDATGALRGGEFHNFARTELVATVLGPLDVALFADAGNVGADVSSYDLNDMRYALGFALRLMSRDTGPVVVSAAYNPDRERGEDEWVVDFTAGVIF
ncbi:MAG: BamA/TamA family outer membrane protein [Planctomycetota bacterium]